MTSTKNIANFILDNIETYKEDIFHFIEGRLMDTSAAKLKWENIYLQNISKVQSWKETHFEIVSAITFESRKDNPKGRVNEALESQGTGGLYELAEELTNKFEAKNKGRQWDGEFFDEIKQFIQEELYPTDPLIDKLSEARKLLSEQGYTVYSMFSKYDVIERGKQRFINITEKQGLEIIEIVDRKSDAEHGISWTTIDCHIDMYFENHEEFPMTFENYSKDDIIEFLENNEGEHTDTEETANMIQLWSIEDLKEAAIKAWNEHKNKYLLITSKYI